MLFLSLSKALSISFNFFNFPSLSLKKPKKEFCKILRLGFVLTTMVTSSGTISVSYISRRSRSPQTPPRYPKVTLKIKDQQGREDFYKIAGHAYLKKLMTTYCVKRSLDYRSVRFLYNGKAIKPTQTPAQLRMKDQDEILSVMDLGGG